MLTNSEFLKNNCQSTVISVTRISFQLGGYIRSTSYIRSIYVPLGAIMFVPPQKSCYF